MRTKPSRRSRCARATATTGVTAIAAGLSRRRPWRVPRGGGRGSDRGGGGGFRRDREGATGHPDRGATRMPGCNPQGRNEPWLKVLLVPPGGHSIGVARRVRSRADNAPKIDYKDARLLGRYVSERGKIVPSRITAVSAKKQRELARRNQAGPFYRTVAVPDQSSSAASKGWDGGLAVPNRHGGTAEDMPNGIIIGVGSGLVSALLFYSARAGRLLPAPCSCSS